MTDAATMRAALREHITGVALVTSAPSSGPIGVTINSLTSISLDPPTVLVCLARGSRGLAGIQSVGAYAVSVLTGAHQHIATRFATNGLSQQSRFHGLPTRTEVTGSPILIGAAAWFDCQLAEVQAIGTHALLFGTVLSAGNGPGSDPPLASYRGIVEPGSAAFEFV